MSPAARRAEGKTLQGHPWIRFLNDSHARPWPKADMAAPLLWPSDLIDPCRIPSAFRNASILFDSDRPTIGSECRREIGESVYWLRQFGRPRHAGLHADPLRRTKALSVTTTAPRLQSTGVALYDLLHVLRETKLFNVYITRRLKPRLKLSLSICTHRRRLVIPANLLAPLCGGAVPKRLSFSNTPILLSRHSRRIGRLNLSGGGAAA